MKKDRIIFGSIFAVILLIGVALGYALAKSDDQSVKAPANSSSTITTFAECAAAGYPIQESYPEVCKVPGGKSFTNN